ncbi:hypothetical protein EKO04_004603 [Ascochyta lentis]|uniref:DJ-1/PfpI domain-containing protein n=1 Tax=Ascochyta lentis TaxID=205686 RepID=A0A8H7J732_9PLEO|nr:hypothetical protein EKO04_004603 [Ascochyta lentis]
MAPYKVAVYLFNGGDLMDFSGPVEIYSASPNPADPAFEVTSFAHHSPISVQTNALVYTPNTTFEEVAKSIADYDILVIPGAHGEVIKSLIQSKEGKELASLIKKFASTPPSREGGRRVLQSVCTGAILLASAGILAGRTVTSHHFDLDLLKRIADQAAGGDSKVNIVRKRWVHAGKTDVGVEIINAGGITSGIDTSLWIYEQFAGKERAEWVAEVEEFEKRSDAWGVQ